MPTSKTTTAARVAARAEAEGASIEFEYDGETYSIPSHAKAWDVDVLEAVEDGKIATAARALVGADQWRQFKAKRRSVEDLNDFFEAMQKAGGFGEGN